jgi:hypothetical protein
MTIVSKLLKPSTMKALIFILAMAVIGFAATALQLINSLRVKNNVVG